LNEATQHGRPSLVTTSGSAGFRISVILLGRIFYRENLIARSGLADLSTNATDAELIVAVYCRHGIEGLEHLEGEFALVIWDFDKQRLIAQRDPSGCWPLYFLVSHGKLAVSTSLGTLRRRQSGISWNLEAFAEFMMQPMPAEELVSEQTPFGGIRRVRPGTIVELLLTGIARVCSSWSWASRISTSMPDDLEEAGHGFAARLRNAVRERLSREGSTAAHLSGGLDSSSIAILARDDLARRSNAGPLFALSIVYNRRGLVGERPYIDLVVEQGGGLESKILEGDDALYFDWFDNPLPIHDEPSGLLVSMPFHRLLFQAADRLGALTTLSGEGSDELTNFVPYHLPDDFRRGRWLKVLKEASTWSRDRNQGLGSVLSKYVFRSLWPTWTREGIRPFLRGGRGRWPELGFFTIPPWVHQDFALRYHLRDRGIANANRMFGYPTEESWNHFALATTSGDWGKWSMAAPLGLNLSHPFRDPRLVCYALGLPKEYRRVPGVTKPLLQAAMGSLLPEKLRRKRDSPGFDDLYGLGLRKNLTKLETMLRESSINELRIFDPKIVVDAMRSAALGVGDAQATDRLDKILALIAWFDQVVQGNDAGPALETRPLDGGRSFEMSTGEVLPASDET